MNGEYLLYLQEIKETEWVIELISEQFDDAMNMMTANSIIYGGAVRDCLAGKNLLGDLDIAVSASECTTMINKFIKNPKWVNISGKNNDTNYKKFASIPKLFSGAPRRSPQIAKIPQIMTFKTLGNKVVQIIILPSAGNDPFQTVTTMVKQVDIVCCGVILTNDNKVFEVIPDAYKDCKKHILHLNNACYVKDIEKFKQRIEKLSERGWINEIDINKVIRAVNRRRKQDLENEKIVAESPKHTSVKPKSHTHNIKKSEFVDAFDKSAMMKSGYTLLRGPYTSQEGATGAEIRFSYANGTEILAHTGYRSVVSSSDIGHIGGLSDTLHALETIAKKYKLDMIIQPVNNCLIIITKNKYVSDQVHEKVVGRVKFSFDGSAYTKAAVATPTNKNKHKVNKLPLYKQWDEQNEDPTLTFKNMNKQILDSLDKKRGLSKNGITKIEKHFNYSTKGNPESVATITNRYYQKIPRGDTIRIGGIAIVLSRLERTARRHEIDIGVIIEGLSVTIITTDEYTGKRVHELLTAGINAPSKTNTKNSEGTTKVPGGIATWR